MTFNNLPLTSEKAKQSRKECLIFFKVSLRILDYKTLMVFKWTQMITAREKHVLSPQFKICNLRKPEQKKKISKTLERNNY